MGTVEIGHLDIFALRALSSAVNARITAVAGAGAIPPMLPKVSARSEFKYGDLIEFTTRDGRTIRARVNRLNDKSIGCTDVVLRTGYNGKWRVAYGLARLVGADRPTLAPLVKLPVPPMLSAERKVEMEKFNARVEAFKAAPGASAPTAPHRGIW